VRKPPTSILVALYLPSLLIIATVALAAVYMQVPVDNLTRDPTAIAELPPFYGILSNLGILLWCTSAVTCLFVWVFLRHIPDGQPSTFLLCSGLLTSMLLFDDLFLFHEVLARQYVGLDEIVVYIIYACVLVLYMSVFWRTILHTEYVLLLSAGAFFAISLLLDVTALGLGSWGYLVEDGSKFLGIAGWCGYYVRTSYQFLAKAGRGDAAAHGA